MANTDDVPAKGRTRKPPPRCSSTSLRTGRRCNKKQALSAKTTGGHLPCFVSQANFTFRRRHNDSVLSTTVAIFSPGRRSQPLAHNLFRRSSIEPLTSRYRVLIATPQIRNAPKSFRISAGTRSNRNKARPLKISDRQASSPELLEIYPVQVCHLKSSYLIENKRPASVLPGTKRRSDKDRRPEGVRSVGRPKDLSSHHQANQFLIATPQIRNAPKSFRISAGTRSNRNKSGGLKLG